MRFIHAFLGCDTTTSVFGIGKGLALKRYLKDCNFRQYIQFLLKVKIFQRIKIINYGEISMSSLYGGKPEEKLDSIR